MHAHGATIGTCMLTQNVPTNIFEQEVLRVLPELNASEITRIACARITTHDFPSSLNRVVPYMLNQQVFSTNFQSSCISNGYQTIFGYY